MTMKYRTALLLAIVLLPLGSLLAADGATPIWEPTTITESGKYILTRNIDGPINIAADGVDLDLNGFTVDTGPSGAVAIGASNVSGINVHDGRLVTSFDATIVFSDVTEFSIRRTVNDQVDDCAISISGSNGTIEDNQFINTQDGPCIGGNNLSIRRNTVNQGLGGMVLSCDDSVIAGNIIDSTFKTIQVNGDKNLIRDNVGDLHIEGDGNTIRENLGVLAFSPQADGNIYRGNSGPGFSDAGTNNTSHGDNYMPGKM